jgi:hypothetical protein
VRENVPLRSKPCPSDHPEKAKDASQSNSSIIQQTGVSDNAMNHRFLKEHYVKAIASSFRDQAGGE